jgi:hypothetical protein
MSARHAEREASPLFELASVLVRLDHVAGRIVNANHGVMCERLHRTRTKAIQNPYKSKTFLLLLRGRYGIIFIPFGILAGEQSSLLTHIAMTESTSLCERMKS